MKPEQLHSDTAFAQRAIEHILCIGNQTSVGFKTVAYPEANACAIECNKIKYVLYNTGYLEASANGNKYVVYGILAHEIGHHVLGNAWIDNVTDKQTLFNAELNADEYAGKILGRLGVPVEEAIKCLADTDSTDTDDHPAKRKREVALSNGWHQGQLNIIPDVEILYELNCQTNINSGFRLRYRDVKKNFFTGKKKATVYVEAIGNNKLRDIHHIDYYLHPTFKNNLYRSDDIANEFSVYLTSMWGNFEMRATIYLKDHREFLLTENLNLFEEQNGKPN